MTEADPGDPFKGLRTTSDATWPALVVGLLLVFGAIALLIFA